MDPKITKKTQDTLGKIIKKPPLTDKLLSKPPFRFLHDIVTSVIKSSGVMKGLYSDAELNSENVKDKESKIAFLQKAIDYTAAASGKQLGVKPAKVVAGHEPEKTNEFLQALAAAINGNVNNDAIVEKVTGKSSGKKEEKKEERKEEKKEEKRERSSDRRKRDDDKKSREKSTEKGSRDREDRHKDREDRHKGRDEKKEDRHRDRDRDREKEDKHKEKERESRHKSGRSRIGTAQGKDNVTAHAYKANQNDLDLDDSDVIDVKSDDNCLTPYPTPDIGGSGLNTTYAVVKPIPRQVSTYREMKRDDFPQGKPSEEYAHEQEEGKIRTKRPKAARLRRSLNYDTEGVADSASLDEVDVDVVYEQGKRKHGTKSRLQDRPNDHVQQSPTLEQKAEKNLGPKTSTPKNSPDPPSKVAGDGKKRTPDKTGNKSTKYADISPRKPGQNIKTKTTNISPGKSAMPYSDSVKRRSIGLNAAAKKRLRKDGSNLSYEIESNVDSGESELVFNDEKDRIKGQRRKHRSKSKITDGVGDSDKEKGLSRKKEKAMYQDDDYAHEKNKRKKKTGGDLSTELDESSDMRDSDDQYYKKKRPHGPGDRRKRSSFTSVFETGSQRREEEGKENDAPPQEIMNGDHTQPSGAPAKMQRPSSAKGSRRRMEAPVSFTEGGELESSDEEEVPAHRQEPTLGQDDVPPQVQGRLARPSSARPAPPKRKEDMAQSEPTMRLGSGKPQNLIIDDGKEEEEEDDTFVVEESAPLPVEPTQTTMTNHDAEEDDEDHGGLVKKIMETKKEYEQQRETKVERPTISDAQRRKQREVVQREIDKLRGSIQTLTRSANPLGKIMDYVQEDLDSMQKELEKWKAENKEHSLALKREKAVTDRAIEPLRAQLSEVDQQIKDQLDLIGAVKCNIIRNDQKIEKMLRTIAKS